jgi:hypothetical protein
VGCSVQGVGFRVWGAGVRPARGSVENVPGLHGTHAPFEAEVRRRTDLYSSQFENNYFTEMCSGSEAGSYLSLIYRLWVSLNTRLGSTKKDKKKEDGPERTRAIWGGGHGEQRHLGLWYQ